MKNRAWSEGGDFNVSYKHKTTINLHIEIIT